MSTCGKCGSHLFRVQKTEPSGSAFILYFVQCSSCGTPVGVLEYNNLGAMVEKLEAKVGDLANEIRQISYDVSLIKNSVRR